MAQASPPSLASLDPVTGLPSGCSVWPPEGLSHPLFGAMAPREQWVVVFTFQGKQPSAVLDAVEGALQAWSQSAGRLDPQDAVHAEEPSLLPSALRLRLHNLQHPKKALERLLVRLRDSAAPPVISEVHLARLAPVQGRDLWSPLRDPRMPEERVGFREPGQFARAVFDGGAPPASEYETQVQGGLQLRRGEVLVEERGAPLWVPPLRLSYGLVPAVQSADAGPRADEVAQALQSALQAAFQGLQPPPGLEQSQPRFFRKDGAFGRVDRVLYPGWVGFSMGVVSSDLVHRYAEGYFRHREAELFQAVAKVVATPGLGLSERVTWQRFGPPIAGGLRAVQSHVVQLWAPAEGQSQSQS